MRLAKLSASKPRLGSSGGAAAPSDDAASPRRGLEERWLTLTRTTLPALAKDRGWPVHADHCFQRILLDHATGGCWYDAIPGRPAYRAAPTETLAAAIALGEAARDGIADLSALNRQSLAWRGKA